MRLHPRSALLLCLALVLPSSALAQWIQDGAGVATGINVQAVPAMISDGSGGIIVTWQDNRGGVITDDIYAQRVDASGVTKWTVDGVAISTAASTQTAPAIVSDGAGGAIIAWSDYRSGTQFDVYAQRINASGVPQWTANGVVVSATTNDQNAPQIVSDGAGGAIIVWGDTRVANADIYAQRLNSAGVAQWTANGIAVCKNSLAQTNFRIASDGAGGFVAAWEDARGGGDIYGVRLNGSGTAQWLLDGLPICVAAQVQSAPAIVSDGAGGAVIAWQDLRTGVSDIYAQRITAAGAPQWLTTDGTLVCNATGNQQSPLLCWDNTTGAIVAWTDLRNGGAATDIYAQRLTPAGSMQWTLTGVPVSVATGNQSGCRILGDGSGGALIAWIDARAGLGNDDVYAQRLSASGQARWFTDGMPVCTAYGTQRPPIALVSDGNGGMFCAWYDGRSVSDDVYVQRIEGRYGYWGRPEPTLFAAKDVPADQGGRVRLEWYASQRDQLDQRTISHYTIWRAIDQAAFASAAAAGAPEVKLTDSASKLTGGAIRHDTAAVDYFWQLVGEEDATYRYAYSFDATTSFDSTSSNAATHRFQVVAHALNDQYLNWPSNVLSGRSVDNLAPPAPLFLTAQRTGNYVYLKWNGVHVPDLDKYTVYRTTSTGVTPIVANFLANDNDTLLTDTSAPTTALYYIVTASDIHQNQGTKSNEAAVAAATGVGNTPPITALTVLPNHPNPFTDETRLQVGLPAKSDVRVEIFDVAGRRVRTTLLPQQTKGWNAVKLDARDDSGRALPSGVYFYRVHAGNEAVTKKMVIAR